CRRFLNVLIQIAKFILRNAISKWDLQIKKLIAHAAMSFLIRHNAQKSKMDTNIYVIIDK
ncbi:MAG: hypothetical protein ACI4F0_07645, partial [Agathobacter sp.]